MDSLDRQVLAHALAWQQAGYAVSLVTVVQTWGSAPRPVGAVLALRHDGVLSGSVSGGCVEDDLIARAKEVPTLPRVLTYGVSADDARRFGLPCGGTLQLVQEPLADTRWVQTVLARTAAHQLLTRTLTLATGAVTLGPAVRGQRLQFDGQTLTSVWGPRWRLLLIGAGQLSQAVAAIAPALDFEVLVCDPREAYALPPGSPPGPPMQRVAGMPDDAVRAVQADAHTAIVALTHDPKLDDMALLEALGSQAFYVGALGSQRNQAARKQRLAAHFGLNDAQLARLHGPVGLALRARTPAEIAIAIWAEIILVKNTQLEQAPAEPEPVCAAAACAVAARPVVRGCT